MKEYRQTIKAPFFYSFPLFFKAIGKEVSVGFVGFKGKWMQSSISIVTMYVVFAYLMPQMGLAENYAPFIILGLIGSFGFYDMVGKIVGFLSDLNGDQSISYLLILPFSPYFALASLAIGWGISGTTITLLLFPLAKLLLNSSWPLSAISPWKFLSMLITVNLFYGFFSLWLASIMKQVKNTGWLWIMIVNPLYMLGSYYTPWMVTKRLSEKLAYAELLNPITYVMEGIRGATLPGEPFLPFWLCCTSAIISEGN